MWNGPYNQENKRIALKNLRIFPNVKLPAHRAGLPGKEISL
jgi:hypothetical protein